MNNKWMLFLLGFGFLCCREIVDYAPVIEYYFINQSGVVVEIDTYNAPFYSHIAKDTVQARSQYVLSENDTLYQKLDGAGSAQKDIPIGFYNPPLGILFDTVIIKFTQGRRLRYTYYYKKQDSVCSIQKEHNSPFCLMNYKAEKISNLHIRYYYAITREDYTNSVTFN